MKKLFLVGLCLLSVLGLIAAVGCYGVGGDGLTGVSPDLSDVRIVLESQQQGISVSGTGKVTVIPDIATLSLGISSQEKSVALAQSRAAEAMNGVMAALKENGVADKDIRTQRFSIQQITRWDEDKAQQVVIGYRVTNMVTVKIRDLDATGTTIDAVATAGGDLTRINSIAFSIEQPEAYHEEAREKAMADAEDKAEQLADGGGIKIGKPTYIAENMQFPPAVPFQEFARAGGVAVPAPTTIISPGEMELTLTVQVNYAILN